MFKGPLMKQITQFFLEGECPTLSSIVWYIERFPGKRKLC